MSKKNCLSKKMVATKSKNKVISCSTPEHQADSPSRDSDSVYDSEAASPVPFLCTQDGHEGETDVVWNFYTPKSEHAAKSRFKNSTPLSRKSKKNMKKVVEKPIQKRRILKPVQRTTELFQDLIELNENLHELMSKKSNKEVVEKPNSGHEDDLFGDAGDCSPKSVFKTNSRCLRRNVLSSKFSKPEPETALESDDSLNECLIIASQVVEEKFQNNNHTPAKRTCYENVTSNINNLKTDIKMDQDSMDAILNSIKLGSPLIRKTKKCESPCLNNDSFDSFVGNLNDSALEKLTQLPIKSSTSTKSKLNALSNDWSVQELVVHGTPSSKSLFVRHNSMPESPSVMDSNKPSTSGMALGRYNSMPYTKDTSKCTALDDSPIRCTPDEIKKKHQQAREKLLAKRLLPFTSTQQSQSISSHSQQSQSVFPAVIPAKKTRFQPRVASTTTNKALSSILISQKNTETKNTVTDMKLIIEKKRQEALMRLRRRQPQSKPR